MAHSQEKIKSIEIVLRKPRFGLTNQRLYIKYLKCAQKSKENHGKRIKGNQENTILK